MATSTTERDARRERAAALAEMVRQRFGKDRALVPSGKALQVEVIPFGLEVLDRWVLGCGGLPRGRMVELYGEAGSGKTSLAYRLAAAAQKGGEAVAWMDTERSFDPDRARAFGVDPDAVVLIQPASLEECADQMKALLQDKAAPGLLVWDSIAETPTIDELTKEAGESVMGRRGQVIGRLCSTLCQIAPKANAALLFVNQIREKIGVAFGDPITTPGGKGPKFFASARLQLMGGKAVKDGDRHVGKDITVVAAKNRFAPPYRKARLRLLYEGGWDAAWSTVDLAKELDLGVSRSCDLDEARAALGWAEKKAGKK